MQRKNKDSENGEKYYCHCKNCDKNTLTPRWGGLVFFKENFTIHGDWCGHQNSKVRLSIYLKNQYFLLQNPKNKKKSVKRQSIV